MEEAVIDASPAAEIAAVPAEEVPAYTVDIVEHVDGAWDAIAANFSDICMEQTAAYMVNRWGDSRLCGLVLRGAMSGEPEAAALVVIAAIPIIKKGLAYVKFGPLWRRRDRPARPLVLKSALSAVIGEFSTARGLLTRVMPPPEPDHEDAWKVSLSETGFLPPHQTPDPERYLVNLRLTEQEQLASLDKNWRKNLKKSLRNEIAVEERPLQSGLPEFLELYRQMAARKGFVDHHHIAYLEDQMKSSSDRNTVRVFLALHSGEPVAGQIITGTGDRLFAAFGASGDKAIALRAGYALRWQVIQKLSGSQARWLDLGGAEGDSGLKVFKAGLVGSRGSIVAMPGEFDCAGSRLSTVATTAMSWAHDLARFAPLQRLTRG